MIRYWFCFRLFAFFRVIYVRFTGYLFNDFTFLKQGKFQLNLWQVEETQCPQRIISQTICTQKRLTKDKSERRRDVLGERETKKKTLNIDCYVLGVCIYRIQSHTNTFFCFLRYWCLESFPNDFIIGQLMLEREKERERQIIVKAHKYFHKNRREKKKKIEMICTKGFLVYRRFLSISLDFWVFFCVRCIFF